MKKGIFLCCLCFILLLVSCNGTIYMDTHNCILQQEIDALTLEKFNVKDFPKINSISNAYYEDKNEVGLFFTLTEEELKDWLNQVIDYIEQREDILYWGKAISQSFRPRECSDIVEFMPADLDEEHIAIAFTTKEISNQKFQDCYRIEIITPEHQRWVKTIDSVDYTFDSVLKLIDCCEYAKYYTLK